MTFSGHRKGDKETIHHYFPSPTQSFIVFEIKKNGYYCILLKRDVDGELEYYKLNSEYKDDFFFDMQNEKQTLLSFDKVKEKLITSGIQLYSYKNKTEVFGEVYQRGKRNNGVVWLEDTVKTDGLSNNFSKIYRYLINSKLIDNKALKDALIISDNRENDAVNFSQKNKKDINDLLRLNEEIKTIKAIQKDFISFREVVNQYKARTKLLAEWIYVFNQQYRPTLADLEYRSLQKQDEITKTKTDLNEELKPRQKMWFTELGGMTASINAESTMKEKIQKELNEIAGFESIEFLRQGLTNLNTERKQLELKITTIETQKLTSEQIQVKLKSITSAIEKLANQIENYNNLLIHKISKNKDDRKLIYAILSPQLVSLPSSRIQKTVTTIANSLKLFDGEIDIRNLEIREIESIEELEERLTALKQDETHYSNLLPIARNYEEFQQKLQETIKKIKGIEAKISRIEARPALEKELSDTSGRIETLKTNRTKAEKELKILEETIFRKEESMTIMSEDKKKIDSRCNELRNQKLEIEQISIDPLEFDSTDGIDTVFKKVTINNNERKEIKITKDKYFDNLRNKLNSTEADENIFIAFIEDEIACLNDKENSIDGLLKSISTHFSNPAFALLAKYEDFKQFVSNKINAKLSKTRISDIESLRIVINDSKKVLSDLKKISEIQDFAGQLFADLSQSENLTLLNTYLDSGKKISFEDLFDIELHLNVKGKEKRVDLAKQVESDGTDRMIRLIIIMSIIHRMIIKSEENRLTIFIDEIATIDNQNRPELIKFCNEHQFMPMFAAPDAHPEFHKYYFIYPSKKQINITEQHNVMWNERN
jgi:hypothetical protein